MSDPVPMTLFDIDAAGLVPTQPAPPEFVQFLYDNSRSGYVTLWSASLTKENGPAVINKWVNNALAVYYTRTLLTQMAEAGPKPEGDHITEITYSGPTNMPPPVCVEVPAVTGNAAVGSTVNCTMGVWGNEPDTYAYQWRADEANVGTDSPSYVIDVADDGKMIDCVVSATNESGTTAAPPSNALLVAGVLGS